MSHLKTAGRAGIEAITKVVPLGARKVIVKAVNRLPGNKKEAVILALLHDWAEEDPAEYHRFIWANHLSYAQYYDFRQIGASRGTYFERLHPHRVELLGMVIARLVDLDVAPAEVGAVLDVGCSLGYLLRYVETMVFPTARRLHGIDIDSYAITEGSSFLAAAGSAVTLEVRDLDDLERVGAGEPIDVITCTGVLHYLDEEQASNAVQAMLARTSRLLALSGVPSAGADNATLARSELRGYDHTFVHNLDRMVAENGGRVVARSWRGSGRVEGKDGAYLVLAEPGHGAMADARS